MSATDWLADFEPVGPDDYGDYWLNCRLCPGIEGTGVREWERPDQRLTLLDMVEAAEQHLRRWHRG